MSALVFREAALSPAESQEDWRTLDLSSGASELSTTPPAGGGWAYSHLNSHRFIVWRTVGGDLDLVEYSLESPLIGNAIRIRFGIDIVPNVMFHEVVTSGDSYLVVLVTLYSSAQGQASLKRLMFEHPVSVEDAYFPPGELRPSVFASASLESLELSIDGNLTTVAKEVPTRCEALDERNVYVGCASGAIVQISLDPLNNARDFAEVAIRESAPLLNTLRGLIPLGQKRVANGVVGLVIFEKQFVFVLHEDAKLRVWYCGRAGSYSATLVLTISVPLESWNPENDASTFGGQGNTQVTTSSSQKSIEAKWSLRLFATEPGFFKLGVFVGLSGDSQVQVYKGSYEDKAKTVSLEMEGVSFYANERMVDFVLSAGQSPSIDEDLVHPKVWALWRGIHQEDGDYVLNHTQISRSNPASQVLEVNNWKTAVLESSSTLSALESLIAVPTAASSYAENIAEPFLSAILQPGRFTPATILRALVFLFPEHTPNIPTFCSSTRELKSIVASHLRLSISARLASLQTDNPQDIFRVEHAQWVKFLEICIQLWKEEHTPLALFSVPKTSGLLVLVKLAAVTVLRETSVVESLTLLSSSARSSFPTSLLTSALPPHLVTNPNSVSSEIFKTLDVLHMISSQLGSAKLEIFEQRLFNLTDPITSATCDVEYLFGSPIDHQSGEYHDALLSAAEKVSRRSFLNRFIRASRAISRLDITLSQLFALIGHTESDENKGTGIYPDLSNLVSPLESDLLDDALIRGFQQCVLSRFDLLRDLLYFALLIIKADLQLNLEASVITTISDLIPRIATQLQAHHVLKWLSSQYVSGDPIEACNEPLRRYGPKVPVAEEILRRRLRAGPVPVIRLYLMDIRSEFGLGYYHRLWRAVGPLVSALVRMTHPETINSDHLALANQLLFRGQHMALIEFIRLLADKSAYHRDLLGDCYLALAQYDKAMDCFTQASVNLEHECDHQDAAISNPLMFSLRQSLLRDRREAESVGLYYWNALLPDLKQKGALDLVVHAANAALSCTASDDLASFSSLYSQIFSASLATGHYEQAYAALISITDDEKKLEALSELVIALIDAGRTKFLTELPFINMLDQVHTLVMARARTADIIDRQPNLYHVLYAFHISKSNYRLAAEAMFVYAERLAVEHHLGLSILERYDAALLAVLSALKLLDPAHAYLVTRRPSHAASPSKRPRDSDSVAGDLHSLSLDKKTDTTKESSAIKRIVEVYDIERIECMHVVAQCNLKLARRDKSLAATGVRSPEATLALLLAQDEFDLAYRLAHCAHLKMEDIFARHALACLRIPSTTKMTEMERWKPLRKSLGRFDDSQTNLHYHVVVADTLLTAQPGISLPIWLVYAFTAGQAASETLQSSEASSMNVDDITAVAPRNGELYDKNNRLLLLYLKHGLTEEAAKLSYEIVLRAKTHITALGAVTKRYQSILPYQYIEQVLVRLDKTSPNGPLHQKVSGVLREYLDLVHAHSEQVENASA